MTDTTTTQPLIYAKMAEAARRIGYGIAKDGRNKQQGYEFTSTANVKKTCGVVLGDLGICVGSELRQLTSEVRDIGAKRGPYVEVVITLTFYAEDGSSVSAQGIGSGMDLGDKACMKAQTVAERYAYMSAFSIAMGEDPEADESIDRGVREEPMERARVSNDPTPPPQDRYTRASQPTQANAPSDTKRLVKTLNPAECLEALTEFGVIGASQRVDFSRGFFACEDADQRVLWKAIKDHAARGQFNLDVIKENMRRAGGE